ncbi:MAG: hypothetical protein IJ806_04240 [Ruminococcus sp.]|nr:hypothetical protein [Ruminococcus sp.]
MNFLCTCCKQRITKGERVSRLVESAGVHNYAYHMEWAVFDEEEISRPITERKWSDRNIQPIVGDKRILRVKRPFDEDLGGVFTNIYEPWQMFYNGWDSAESPEDIQKTCAVLCRFDEVLWADEFSAYIVVTVLHTLPLCRLHQVFPETVTDRNFSRSLVSVMMSGRSMRTSICSIVHGLLRAISAMCC